MAVRQYHRVCHQNLLMPTGAAACIRPPTVFKEPDQYPWQSAHSPNLRLEGASFPGSNFDCAPEYFSA
jgi:hypothetical protein